MAERKGVHWLVWVGGGCAVLVLLAVVAIGGLGLFAAKKVTDIATEATQNPIATMAKTYAFANPEIEFVDADEDARTVTFRNTDTGEIATFDFSELEAGRIRFEGSEGEVSVGRSEDGDGMTVTTPEGSARFGGSSSELPEWVPMPPGAEPAVTFTQTSGEIENGAFQVRAETVDDAAATWRELLVGAGFEIETEASQVGLKMLVGRRANRQISVGIAPDDGAAVATVTYATRTDR